MREVRPHDSVSDEYVGVTLIHVTEECFVHLVLRAVEMALIGELGRNTVDLILYLSFFFVEVHVIEAIRVMLFPTERNIAIVVVVNDSHDCCLLRLRTPFKVEVPNPRFPFGHLGYVVNEIPVF